MTVLLEGKTNADYAGPNCVLVEFTPKLIRYIKRLQGIVKREKKRNRNVLCPARGSNFEFDVAWGPNIITKRGRVIRDNVRTGDGNWFLASGGLAIYDDNFQWELPVKNTDFSFFTEALTVEQVEKWLQKAITKGGQSHGKTKHRNKSSRS